MICPHRRFTSNSQTVSTPIGISRHYRVQVRQDDDGSWRLHASFRDAAPADECLTELLARGLDARLIRYDRCPSAA